MSQSNKLILVIGATGVQGRAVIDALLAPGPDGTTSPYSVRALTRNFDSRSAKELAAIKKVELFQGSFTDAGAIYRALEGCYGAFVNTDGSTEEIVDTRSTKGGNARNSRGGCRGFGVRIGF
ncbi:NAD(P)-binding protein [Sistotremastrum suecicum HHB10207 ss-3]|uniref:NAD(P)-binding protein n=1 Tax=Sistotremastrum suecicum HHB10207 ss-3 TaxID=1314776 RepID=A0A165YNY1_9AGAM|nr:NAD(P)-binding protein [Sistotremastrum suecicum HHB10207 ss-3]